MTNNTKQHDTTRGNTSKARVQYDKTRVQRDTARDNTSTIRRNINTARPNTSTKEALAAKLGPYFTFFVNELHIFLISFRNS